MLSEKDNILEINQKMKSDKIPYIIYADVESLIKKIEGCANNPENSSTGKIDEHVSCGYPISAIWAFDHIENKHSLYSRKDCMKKFREYLRKHAKNIMDFEKKNMLPLTKEELKSHQDAKVYYICRERILQKLSKSIGYWKVIDHCHYIGKYRGAAHSICNSKFSVPSEIPIAF